MNRTICCILFLGALHAGAGVCLATDIVGCYFDTTGTSRCATSEPYVPIIANICLRDPSGPGGIGGWQGRIVVQGNCYVNYTLAGTTFNIEQEPIFHVACSDTVGLRANSHNLVILGAVTIVPYDMTPISISIRPGNTLLNSNIVYAMAAAPENLIDMTPASGDSLCPVAWVNSNAWPCGNSAWERENEVLVRLVQPSVQISNPAGGDVRGNVAILKADLDSVVTEYQVTQIAKYNAAGPESTTYRIRGIDIYTSSGEMANTFRFLLPDTSSRNEFAASVAELDGVAFSVIPAHSRYKYGSRPASPNDPFLGWHINNEQSPGISLEILNVYNSTVPPAPEIGFIDSGCDIRNPDLPIGRIRGTLYPIYNWPHGTQTSGLVMAIADNEWGIAGLPGEPSLFMAGLQEPSGIAMADLLSSLKTRDDLVVANISLFNDAVLPNADDFVLKKACASFFNSNRLVVSGSGWVYGTAGPPVGMPARWNSVLGVGVINQNGYRPIWSIYGMEMDLVAPGVGITTLTTADDSLGNGHMCVTVDGSSSTAAMVSGIANLLLAFKPDLYNDDIVNLLLYSADKENLPNYNMEQYGYGQVQAESALQMMLGNSFVVNTAYGYDGDLQGVQLLDNIWTIWGADGIPDGTYEVTVYKVQKMDYYQVPFARESGNYAWCRSVASTGAAMAYSEEMFDGKLEGKVTSVEQDHVELEAYVYRMVNVANPEDIVWYPEDIQTNRMNMKWTYVQLGETAYEVDVEDIEGGRMIRAGITRTSPSPFNARVRIEASVRAGIGTTVDVYDLRGQHVRTLYRGSPVATKVVADWDGCDDTGRSCASGVYVVHLRSGGQSDRSSVVLVK